MWKRVLTSSTKLSWFSAFAFTSALGYGCYLRRTYLENYIIRDLKMQTSEEHGHRSFQMHLRSDHYDSPSKEITLIIAAKKGHKLHEEVTAKVLDVYSEFLSQMNFNITIKIIDSSQDFNLLSVSDEAKAELKKEYSKMIKSNQPNIYIKQGDYLDKIEVEKCLKPKYLEEVNHDLTNLVSAHRIHEYSELREQFKHVENDLSKSVIVVSSNYKGDVFEFKKANRKLLIVENQELIARLNLADDKVYEYLCPKLPNKLRFTSLEKFLESQTEYNEKDLQDHFSSNTLSFLIKFNLFRNEYSKIPDEELPYDPKTYFPDKTHWKLRKEFIRGKYAVKRNIDCIAKLDEDEIVEEQRKKNRHNLLIYVPTLSYLNEKILKFVLYGKLALINLFRFTAFI